jgi:predicted ATPase with chaperone activity
MSQSLGEMLIQAGVVTKEQVTEALERQKLYGGRLGRNLISLGSVSKQVLETFLHRAPPRPRTLEDTGLPLEFISELALKIIFYLGTFTIGEIVSRIKLPADIVDAAIQSLRQDKLCEVKGGTGYAAITYTFAITSAGRQRAAELIEKNHYAGPAPVPLEDYTRIFDYQTSKNIFIPEERLREAFSPFVLSDRVFEQLGPAVNSGKSIFIYGPAGNGKTALAEAIGSLLGEEIYIPYAISVDREIINIYDPINHKKALAEDRDAGKNIEGAADARWVRCKRPVVLVGGELTLSQLELEYNPSYKFYEAPLQMKANGGVFIIDDFGRQLVSPRHLLNRWIVPLERRTDFLTLRTGKKFEIPFEQLVVFSTNIEPRELVDEAFLRRIRYKVKMDHPTKEEFREIFRLVCEKNFIEFKPDVVDYLLMEHYGEKGVELNACHPRDLIDQIIDMAHFQNKKPELTKEALGKAWVNYFVD